MRPWIRPRAHRFAPWLRLARGQDLLSTALQRRMQYLVYQHELGVAQEVQSFTNPGDLDTLG